MPHAIFIASLISSHWKPLARPTLARGSENYRYHQTLPNVPPGGRVGRTCLRRRATDSR